MILGYDQWVSSRADLWYDKTSAVQVWKVSAVTVLHALVFLSSSKVPGFSKALFKTALCEAEKNRI
jgi:hypothetical protein